MVKGKIHSFETCGTVDGPGIRCVVFMQGCKMRCLYCHNPDTWKFKSKEEVTVDSLVAEIEKYRSYITFSKGGVTLTGGEPLLQPEFTEALIERLKEKKFHVAVDTSACADLEDVERILPKADLVLLDLKCIDNDIHKRLTGQPVENILKTADFLSSIKKPMWIRHVLVPDITDNDKLLNDLARFISTLTSVERVEILPFHKMGEYKWETLGYRYLLANTQPPSKERVKNAKNIFKNYGLKVI